MRPTVIIIGSAAAEPTSGTYAGHTRLDPSLTANPVEADGKLHKSTDAGNFTGFPDGILGLNLIVKTEQQ